MKIHEGIYILEVPMDWGGGTSILNLVLVDEKENGLTLIDTGMPGQRELILDAIKAEGFDPASVSRIVITHADIDHIGSLDTLKESTRASVISFVDEADYISGAKPSAKMPPPERLAENPQLKAMLERKPNVLPDQLVNDGDLIPGTKSLRAVATPGHTPGHMSVYIEGAKVLVTGDALTSAEGVLRGPMEQATPDMASAWTSVQRLAEFDVDLIVAYHGGLVSQDANSQLKKLAESSVSERVV